MAGQDGGSQERTLEQTPTWAVAAVCAIIILISIALEKFLHKLGTLLIKRHKKHLFEALDKIKTELMILGFISLILVFSQQYIAGICIPTGVADTMLPCPPKATDEHHQRRLLFYDRRVLAAAKEPSCEPGRVSLISAQGLHQLHILLFFLAVFHVIYSAITMTLGRLKIRGWKKWEMEASASNSEHPNDPPRARISRDTSFVKAHASCWTRIPCIAIIGCFFRQFFRSVNKSDYLTMRNGFINAHLSPGSKFNFQRYIKRSLEDDFKTVVGVSPVLWGSFVVFLLLNISDSNVLVWASFIPLVLLLAIGTKLQSILTRMATEIEDKHSVVEGIPLVQGSDSFFWFGQPKLLLHLIHFVLFQNAFQVTYFLWIWYEYGLRSCFHDNFGLVLVKIGLGAGVLVLCSYITLPLYALITQMGSHMKKTIFDEQTSKALEKWTKTAKKHAGHGRRPSAAISDHAAAVVDLEDYPSTTGGIHESQQP